MRGPPGFRRPIAEVLLGRLAEPRHLIQVLSGPRQAGKTTLAHQVLQACGLPSHYAAADALTPGDQTWIEAQWQLGRRRAGDGGPEGAVLVLDEVQKVPAWSEVVKRLWDEDSAAGSSLHVVLLGSAPLLVQRGLSESLAGRFELIRVPHWSFAEMREAFGWGLDQYVYFGGYPGAAPLVDEPGRWASYVLDSLVETTVSRDVMLLSRVDKPALLRRLFHLGCEYSGQVLSYNKMLGQLQDAGNTTTLAHYLELLGGAGLLTGLQKYSGAAVRRRGSSPKLVVLNTALMSSVSGLTFDEARARPDFWGRLLESAVGAHLVNGAGGAAVEVSHWRDRGHEVDYVLARAGSIVALEVKSGRAGTALPGLEAFTRRFPGSRPLLVGSGGIPLDEFLVTPINTWLA